MKPASSEITKWLTDYRHGNKGALDQLMPLVYDELRRLAEHCMRQERSDHTLQPTALVHETYLRLVGQTNIDWQSRAHFFGTAAHLIRQILVQHARAHQTAKRGGTSFKWSLETAADVSNERAVDLIALDDALAGLAKIDPRQSRLVELRFFGGLRMDEVAEVLGVSPITAKRNWRTARAWLHREIRKESRHDP